MGYQNKNFVSQISYLVGVEWISQGSEPEPESEPASQMRLWLHPKGPAPTALALALAPASIHCETHKLIMVNSQRYDFNELSWKLEKCPEKVLEMSWNSKKKCPGKNENVLEMSWNCPGI